MAHINLAANKMPGTGSAVDQYLLKYSQLCPYYNILLGSRGFDREVM